MAIFGRDDYGYDYDIRSRGAHPRHVGYRRNPTGTWGAWPGYGAGARYDEAYRGYGRDYRNDRETDYGDPFGDRQSGTPIRVMRERYDEGYDRGMRGYGGYRTRGYGREYEDYDRGYWRQGYDARYGRPGRRGEGSWEHGWFW